MVQIWNSHDKSIKNTTNTKNTNNTDDTDNTDYSNKGLGGSGVAGKSRRSGEATSAAVSDHMFEITLGVLSCTRNALRRPNTLQST